MKLDIHIKWNNDKSSLQIPILPESFEIEDSINNTTVNIHNLGDINLKGKRGLYGLSFESFFPEHEYDFEHCAHKDSYDYIKKLKTLFEKNTTVHVIVTETDIKGFFTIESFNYGHNEKTLDVRYSISFREYRTISSTSVGTSNKGRQNKGVSAKTIKWKKGDTWQKLTKSVLGSSATWKKQRKNNIKVVNKAMKLKKGEKKKKENVALIGYKVVIKP